MTELIPTIAGSVSTTIFATSFLPMLIKAFRTKDLRSYSLSNIALTNAGNLIHSVYVYSLPPGPIWMLHSFYLISAGLMLLWYAQYEFLGSRRTRENAQPDSPGASIKERLALATGRLFSPCKPITACGGAM